MQKLIEEHNNIIEQIENLEKQLKSMKKEVLEGFKVLTKEQSIEYYDQLSDSQIKYELFLYLRNKYLPK